MSEKRNLNFWLEDKEFISRTNFKDTYYLEILCHKISSFIKKCPVPLVTSMDNKHQRILFMLGKIQQAFKLDVDISYYDYVEKVKQGLKQYYPQYEIEIEKDVDLTDEEKLFKVQKEKLDLNDVIFLKKKQLIKEKGIIEKVFFKEDMFLLNRNGIQELRTTAILGNPMPISKFKESLFKITNQYKKYEYIEQNSKLIKIIDKKSEIHIEYSGKQMLNFFKIRYESLKDYQIEKINDFTYVWGRFKIHFNSESLKDDCFKLYNEMKKEK